MTKNDALTLAINELSSVEEYSEAVATLTKMREQINKPRSTSPEAKAKANALRKAKTAEQRTALVAQVAPILREVLTHTQLGLTAKEIFNEAQDRLPEGFSAAKVQNILLREMAPELVKTEAKGKANTYRLAE